MDLRVKAKEVEQTRRLVIRYLFCCSILLSHKAVPTRKKKKYNEVSEIGRNDAQTARSGWMKKQQRKGERGQKKMIEKREQEKESREARRDRRWEEMGRRDWWRREIDGRRGRSKGGDAMNDKTLREFYNDTLFPKVIEKGTLHKDIHL